MGKIVGLTFSKEANIDKERNNIKLNELTINALKDLAHENGIEFNSKIKKDDLIVLIENYKESDEVEEENEEEV